MAHGVDRLDHYGTNYELGWVKKMDPCPFMCHQYTTASACMKLHCHCQNYCIGSYDVYGWWTNVSAYLAVLLDPLNVKLQVLSFIRHSRCIWNYQVLVTPSGGSREGWGRCIPTFTYRFATVLKPFNALNGLFKSNQIKFMCWRAVKKLSTHSLTYRFAKPERRTLKLKISQICVLKIQEICALWASFSSQNAPKCTWRPGSARTVCDSLQCLH